jgi:peptide/nickel transport system substrate-binding protein
MLRDDTNLPDIAAADNPARSGKSVTWCRLAGPHVYSKWREPLACRNLPDRANAARKRELRMMTDRMTELIEQLHRGELSRRGFLRAAGATGMSLGAASALAATAGAQATPSASPVAGAGATSITRDAYLAQLREAFGWEDAASTGGQVIMVSTADIQTLNPNIASDIPSSHIHYNTFSRLCFDSAIDGSQRPDLADVWEISGDGLVYTFHLNPDARFHDGEPVTAGDVVFSFDSILDESSLSVRRSDLLQVVESYQAIDDRTFELTARDTFATTLIKSAKLVAILPRHIWEPIPFADWGTAPGATGEDPAQVVGSGPFRFEEWVANDHVTVVRNEDYFVPEMVPAIDAFTLRVTPEESSALQTLSTGETDIAEVPTPQADTLRESDPNLVIDAYDTTEFSYLGFNMDPERSPLFVEIPVRQAMMYALDRELVAQEILMGYSIRADGTQTPLSSAYDPTQVTTVYEYNTELAGQLLDEAGWVMGDDGVRAKDGVRFSFELQFPQGEQAYGQMVPYFQQAWGEIGIEMQTAELPFTTLLDNANARTFDALLLNFIWFVDGDQGSLFRCDATPPNGFNQVGYCNPEFDRLNDEQLLELDVERRDQLLLEQSNIANDEVAIGMLFFDQAVVASQPRLHNFKPNGYGILASLPFVWVEE